MPAGSKMDPPLAKAEPISNSGSTSVITYLRKGKKLLCTPDASDEVPTALDLPAELVVGRHLDFFSSNGSNQQKSLILVA